MQIFNLCITNFVHKIQDNVYCGVSKSAHSKLLPTCGRDIPAHNVLNYEKKRFMFLF